MTIGSTKDERKDWPRDDRPGPGQGSGVPALPAYAGEVGATPGGVAVMSKPDSGTELVEAVRQAIAGPS